MTYRMTGNSCDEKTSFHSYPRSDVGKNLTSKQFARALHDIERTNDNRFVTLSVN